MTHKPDPPRTRGPQPSSASLLLDQLFDDGRHLSHEERIEQLVKAALRDGPARLRFENELARGGMGAVRMAFDATLQRRMAVKTMHAKTYEHVMLVHGFLREAQVTGQLDHPNIVPIHELGRDGHGELYFTMKLVDGESLKAKIKAQPPESWEQMRSLLEIFVKVCDALAFAHNRGVIHCDIKSANVMVGKYGQVYLMDWGGAQLLPPRPGADTTLWVRDSLPPLPASETQGMVFGTPSYMSPEQASAGREPLDERSDVFSMGALLYEMMTGRPPYHGGTPMEGILRAQIVDIVAPEDCPHLYPHDLIRIVMTAMARDPGDRWQTVLELQAAIAGLLHGGQSAPRVRFKAREHIIREGEVGDAAYWIESGTCEVYQVKDGERRSLRILKAGEFFGETAIFAHTTRTANVVAMTDMVLKRFGADEVVREMEAMVPWMRAAVGALARRFGGAADGRSGLQAVPARAPTGATATGEAPREPTIESVLLDIEDLGPGPEAAPDPDDTEGVADDESDTRLIGPWTKKPPPRPG
ncbi:MAG: protein kinase [Myxococcales bacterium]|nr:protein kinase [Myxococcales bacterium]